MQGNGLHADEVLPGGEVLRERERHSRNTLSGERDGLAAVGDSRDLVHLEPDGAVAREARHVAGRLGHVDVDDPGVVDRAVGHDAELRTGGDGDRLRGGARLRVVAAEVGGGNVRDWRLGVEVVRLADVRPGRGRRAADYEGREGVCVGGLCEIEVEGGGSKSGSDLQWAEAAATRVARARTDLNILERLRYPELLLFTVACDGGLYTPIYYTFSDFPISFTSMQPYDAVERWSRPTAIMFGPHSVKRFGSLISRMVVGNGVHHERSPGRTLCLPGSLIGRGNIVEIPSNIARDQMTARKLIR